MENEPLSRNILLFGEITTEKIESVMQRIIEVVDYDEYVDSTVKNYERQPITLYICSGGGEVLPTIGLCEFMAYCRTPISTVCLGEACSAAFMVLIAGHCRFAVRGSSIMFHQMAGGAAGSVKNCKNHIEHMDRIESYMTALIKERTEIPQKMLDEIYTSQMDRYMSVEEALELRVIDYLYGGDEVELDAEIEESDEIDNEESDDENPCNT